MFEADLGKDLIGYVLYLRTIVLRADCDVTRSAYRIGLMVPIQRDSKYFSLHVIYAMNYECCEEWFFLLFFFVYIVLTVDRLTVD